MASRFARPAPRLKPQTAASKEMDRLTRRTLLMGEARVLLMTWEAFRDKAAIERHLKRTEKLYGKGSEQTVREYMRQLKKDERSD